MTQSHIQTRVWLSIGIFVLGFLFTTTVSQVEQRRAERGLTDIADAFLPAAESGRSTLFPYTTLFRSYGTGFLIGDRSGLDRAGLEGRRAIKALHRIGATQGINSERTRSAERLATTLTEFLEGSAPVYGGSLPVQGETSPELLDRFRRLTASTTMLDAGLQSLANGLAGDLQQRMDELRSRSATVRLFTLSIFAATLVLAAILVNLTIRRSVLAPLERIQNELAQERDLLRILMDHIPDTIYFKDAESKFIRVNRAQATMLGIDNPQEAIGRSDADYFDAAVARKSRADEQRILETGEPLVGSIERITRQGVTRWVTASKVRVRDEARNTNLLVGISRDMTEWKRTVEALEESEESLRLLFAAIPQAVWVYDVETLHFLKVNEAACRRYGDSAEEFERITVSELHASAEASRLESILAQLWDSPDQVLPQGAWQYRTRAGGLLEVEVHTGLLRFKDRPA